MSQRTEKNLSQDKVMSRITVYLHSSLASERKLPTENINRANQILQDVYEEIFVLSDNELGFCDENANEFICNEDSNNKDKVTVGKMYPIFC